MKPILLSLLLALVVSGMAYAVQYEEYEEFERLKALRIYICDQPIQWWGGIATIQKTDACSDLEEGFSNRHKESK